ncbi:hypothetical protein EVAR_18449_1 [Eumeta japonica]|uniref:Uncharacterized protein n=1 Tax=Eumeta variegata TaxID=151549 RepID=A0A4C1V090_EUMVA|nr:hypothetical protein EVAR_18449_1 [Eumeta japonica]
MEIKCFFVLCLLLAGVTSSYLGGMMLSPEMLKMRSHLWYRGNDYMELDPTRYLISKSDGVLETGRASFIDEGGKGIVVSEDLHEEVLSSSALVI